MSGNYQRPILNYNDQCQSSVPYGHSGNYHSNTSTRYSQPNFDRAHQYQQPSQHPWAVSSSQYASGYNWNYQPQPYSNASYLQSHPNPPPARHPLPSGPPPPARPVAVAASSSSSPTPIPPPSATNPAHSQKQQTPQVKRPLPPPPKPPVASSSSTSAQASTSTSAARPTPQPTPKPTLSNPKTALFTAGPIPPPKEKAVEGRPPPAKKQALAAPPKKAATPEPARRPTPQLPQVDCPYPYILPGYGPNQKKAARLKMREQLGITHEEICKRECQWREQNSHVLRKIEEIQLQRLVDPNKGRKFREMPVDIFFEIASHLSQTDLIALSLTSRQHHAVLTSSMANPIWIGARAASGIPSPDKIAEWNVGIDERFSARILAPMKCMLCVKAFPKSRSANYWVYLSLRVTACLSCIGNQFVDRRTATADPKYHPQACDFAINDTKRWSPVQGYQNLATMYPYNNSARFFRPALEAVSKRLFQLAPSHAEEVAQRGEASEPLTAFEVYQSERLEIIAKRSLVGERVGSLLELDRVKRVRIAAEEQRVADLALRQAQAAALRVRMDEIERRLRPAGWTDVDFASHSWKSHQLVRRYEPITDTAHPTNGWSRVQPVLQLFLESEETARLAAEAARRLQIRKNALHTERERIIDTLAPRAQSEFISLAEFMALPVVAEILEALDPADGSGVSAQAMLGVDGKLEEIRLAAETQTRVIKLALWKKIQDAEEKVALAYAEDEEENEEEGDSISVDEDSVEDSLPDPSQPFPDRFRKDMDSTLSQYSNQFKCPSCHKFEHYPAILNDHHCSRRYYSTRNDLPASKVEDIDLDYRRMGVARSLLKMASVKDQRTTPVLADKVTKKFTCLTCEGKNEANWESTATNLVQMVEHVVESHPEVEGSQWRFPEIVFETQKAAKARSDLLPARGLRRGYISTFFMN